MPVQVAVTLLAEAGVQSARAASPASSTIARAIAKTMTKDRAVAKMAERRSQRLGKDSSEIPDFFIVKSRPRPPPRNSRRPEHFQQDYRGGTIRTRHLTPVLARCVTIVFFRQQPVRSASITTRSGSHPRRGKH
jgi:hypothetical protein